MESTKVKAVWKLKKDSVFTIKSFYDYLANKDGDGVRLPPLQIWKVKVPPTIPFFACEAGQKCILIIDKLMKMGRIMVHGCYRKKAAEPCNHLLL